MIELLRSGRLWRMCLKELRETLRDRRTLFTLVLMPLLVYPVLSLALQRLILNSASTSNVESHLIGVSSEADLEILSQTVSTATGLNDLNSYRPFRYNSKVEESPLFGRRNKGSSDWNVLIMTEPEKDVLASGEVDLIITITQHIKDSSLTEKRIDPNLSVESKSKTRGFLFTIGYRQNDARSESALAAFRTLLQTINEYEASQLRVANNLPTAAPCEMIATATITDSSMTSSLASVIPLVLVLMTITGAVYPAIDLTAGERERGTMEALIATPVSRFALLLSKYVAVMAVAILTAVANLSAMYVTLRFSGIAQTLLGKEGFPITSVLAVLPLLIVFSAFFSAVLLALCSVAKSFKEAQAYLIPVILLSMGPGILSLLPSVKLTPTMAVLPLINMILMARECLAGQLEIIPGIIAVVSTLFYAAGSMAIAAQLFGLHAVPQHSDISWRSWLRPSLQSNPTPSTEQLSIYLAFFFPIYFVVIHVLAGVTDVPLEQRIWWNATATLVLFAGLPSLFAYWCRLSFLKTFPVGEFVRWWKAIPGLFLVSIAMWTVAHEILVFSETIGIASLDLEQMTELQQAKEEFIKLPLFSIWFAMAIAIAVAEEWFFRGFVLRGLLGRVEDRRGVWIAILSSATLFGLFHTIAPNLLAIERFFPTAALGLIIGWISWRTGSLIPGMLVHAFHNGLLFTMPRYEETLQLLGLGVENQKHLPIAWIAGGAVCVATGLLWITRSSRPIPLPIRQRP